MPNYGDKNYWDRRYERDSDMSYFDWLEDFDSLKAIFESVLNSLDTGSILSSNIKGEELSPNILMLGCGDSSLTEKLYMEMGTKMISNIDYSSLVIEKMKKLHPQMNWSVMDARDLKYGHSSFDLVVDKAMMDSILCGDSPFLNVAVMLKEVQRVLKIGGVYMLITYGDPDSRMSHLTRGHLNFDIKFQCLKKSYYIQSEDGSNSLQEKTHYIYLCKKKPGADLITNNNFQNVFCELEREDVIGFDQEDEENFGDEII